MVSKKKAKTLDELLEEALVPEEEQPYGLPEGWLWTKLGFLGLYQNGKAFKSKDWSDKGRPIIRIQDLTGTNKGKMNYFNGELESKYEVFKGDFLISWSATLGAYIWQGEEAVLNQHIFKVKTFIDKLYHYYLILNSINLLSSKTQGTGMVHVTKKDFENTNVPLPPFKEQLRIVKKIESKFRKINEAQQLIEEAKETFEIRKQSILDMAFCGDLIGDKESWQELKLGDLILDGPQNGLYKPQTAYGEGSLIVRIDNFYSGYINEWNTLRRLKLNENETELYGLYEGDLLINRVNSIQYLGKSALVRNLQEDCVFESNVMRLKINNELVDKEYLILYLNSNRGLKELRKNAKHAVNQASINQSDVKNVIVPLPNLVQQELIVEKALELLEKDKMALQLIRQQRKVLEELKQSILSKAFKGELGTYDSNDDSAIELLKSILQEKF